MDLDKFFILLAGLLPDTPLGNIIQIRSETDPDIIKHMSPGQKKIRDEWLVKRRKERYESMSEEEQLAQLEELQRALAKAFA